jgi:hypothetical protein
MGVSIAVLMDNAREVIVGARESGLDTRELLVSVEDYEAVDEAKSREQRRTGLTPRIFGIVITPSSDLRPGDVRIPLDDLSTRDAP